MTSMENPTDEKKQRLLGSLELGMTMVHLDARKPGVIVPNDLKKAHLALNLSYRFDPPDLAISDWGVRSTLTFSGKRFTVGLPWSSIYGISSHVSGEFWMYPNDIPKEVLESAAERHHVAPLSRSKEPEIALLEEVAAGPLEDAGTDHEEKPPPVKRGHLRVVK
jgi:stringent starvation protein B